MSHRTEEPEDQRDQTDPDVTRAQDSPGDDAAREEMGDGPYEVDDAESAGTADPTAKFREEQPSQEEIDQIERERAERLAPENRPPNAEVDNTQRTFDPTKGDFID